MINNKEIQKTEIINGVTGVYGNYEVTDDPQINKLLYLNSIKFYDLDGNEFYANYDDINEAKRKCEIKNKIHPETPYDIYVLRFELQLFKRYIGEEKNE